MKKLFKNTILCMIWLCFTGAAYAQCENELRQLVEGCKLPFLPTPMGKGTLPDEHKLCVAPARSK